MRWWQVHRVYIPVRIWLRDVLRHRRRKNVQVLYVRPTEYDMLIQLSIGWNRICSPPAFICADSLTEHKKCGEGPSHQSAENLLIQVGLGRSQICPPPATSISTDTICIRKFQDWKANDWIKNV